MEFQEQHKNNRKRGTLLFFSSLAVYLLIALLVNRQFIGSDGRSYQRMAVNMAEGNGFSNSLEAPYEKMFFREPGYPFFFSLACRINKLAGNTNLPLPYADPTPGYYGSGHSEILILRLLQAVLAALTVLFFYRILLLLMKPRPAFLIPLAFILYFPFAVYVTFPQREILETTLMTLMSWLFLKSALEKKSLLYDLLFALLAAALILTLQAYVYILPFFLLSHFLLSGSIRKTLISTLTIATVFILGILPWGLRAYNTAHDLRVFKSFGTSYTYEYRKFHEANARAYRLNLDGEGEKYKERIVASYQEPGKTMFEKSFDGSYIASADSLNNITAQLATGSLTERISSFTRLQLKNNVRKALIWPLWKSDYRKNLSTLGQEGKASLMAALLPAILVALLFLSGLLLYGLRTWFLFPVFTFHLVMIPVMADEARRMLPWLPWYFMYSLIALYLIIKTFSRKPGREIKPASILNEYSLFHLDGKLTLKKKFTI
ncbi:MAG: hypothetical protein ACOYXB_09620 [Bacteroidota bacterium]